MANRKRGWVDTIGDCARRTCMKRSRKILSPSHGGFHDGRCRISDVQVGVPFLEEGVASSWQLQSTIGVVRLFAPRIVR